ncbi:P-loop containing nucleoside triphosphate hydrolase protein [Parathielavia hyrcaniae]|uniref:P-loop containing nucleoside triphosphate hydrolase protein n=1 Tax=Parathielavia hyrcaniae TaxID=113614 RepID=A0AAN6PWP3_9PEZI|nr:P-loop containing nucleoside triphosphate hydrolase protein [Parathielavia hyrcaniae]
MAAPNAPLQTRMVDDKSPICIPFILSRLAEYRAQHAGEPHPRPFIVGLNGVQGVGKTTLVRALAETLQDREGLPTLVISIDDFYLTHADQLALAAAHPDNALLQYRGEPGTHDLPLLTQFLTSLTTTTTTNPPKPTPIPQYDKSAFSGQGDRLPPSDWPTTDPANPPQVLILEGWCVGFRPLRPPSQVESRWKSSSPATGTLRRHKLEHLLQVNSALEDYDRVLNGALDVFVHIDAEDTAYVYAWRAEQEAQLRRERGDGAGMSEEEVVRFVDAYYPAYELFADGVREGVFRGEEGKKGCQLRLVVGRDRMVKESMVI